MTFKEAMLQYESFEYSKENFEIMKECAEIELAEHYIRSQLFMQENADVIGQYWTESTFFMESAQDDNLEVLMEATQKKKGNLMGKILRGLIKIYLTFQKFLGRIKNSFNDSIEDSKKIVKALSKSTLTKDQLKAIQDLIKRSKKDLKAFIVRPMQPFFSKIQISTEDGKDGGTELKNDLAAGLSYNKVTADVRIKEGNDTIGIIPFEAMAKASAVFKTKSSVDFKVGVDILKTAWVDAKKNGVSIDVIPDVIEKQIEMLGKIMEDTKSQIEFYNQLSTDAKKYVGNQMDNFKKYVNGKKADAANAANNPGPEEPEPTGKIDKAVKKVTDAKKKVDNKIGQSADTMTKISDVVAKGLDLGFDGFNNASQKLLNMLNSTVGSSMRMYSEYLKYRTSIITGMKSIVSIDSK